MNMGSLGLYITFLGLLAAIYQLRQNFLQQRTIFEDSISKEYRDIIQRIPYRALIGEEIPLSEASAVQNEVYNYMDLCNEQIYLRMSNRVSKKTWNNWQEGMKTNFELKVFNDTLNEVFEKLPSNFIELQSVKALNFSTDPKKYKISDNLLKWILD
ncbi:hypothetical protein [Psychrobacter sp. UBA3480]|uniref:hypothetical protein n=1 Tax=Psychrobacter sp. UBA3480 TaxID=1947350 RepID=UPI0025D64D84|nr:hypothetical protein [Psychrobacter sp. UBA3480]